MKEKYVMWHTEPETVIKCGGCEEEIVSCDICEKEFFQNNVISSVWCLQDESKDKHICSICFKKLKKQKKAKEED